MKQNEETPKDPFDGFFRRRQDWKPEKGSLLDIPLARRWMKVVGWGSRNDLYTFQQALESKQGPVASLRDIDFITLSSYDYLGLIGHPAIEQAAIDAVRAYGTGTGGVRLLTGTNELHRQLESALAGMKRTEAALTFSSGYLANLAAISALLNDRDIVLADEFIHRSLIDALKLSGVPYQFFPHNCPKGLERLLCDHRAKRRRLILVEGTYSMDGDLCPLPEIVCLKENYDAFLLVDEAHSFGVLGENGSGIEEFYGLPPGAVDIFSGSLSKAIPSNGGFLAGSEELIYYLQHGAAPYMFSASLAPPATAAALQALDIVRQDKWRRQQLVENTGFFKRAMTQLGYAVGEQSRHIIPLIVGPDEQAYRLARMLYDHRILASAVVFPAVPPGQARLRLCMTAAHSRENLDEVVRVFAALKPQVVYEQT